MAEIDLTKPLMPKAKALWLYDNSTLSFNQIASFTGLEVIEVQALVDEDVGKGIQPISPIDSNELTREEIERCEKDGKAVPRMRRGEDLPNLQVRAKGPRYTPVSKRADKPSAIAFILKNRPEITDAQICKLIGTTKPTIDAVRDRTHTTSSTLKPQHPAELMLCSYQEYQLASRKALIAVGKDPDEEDRKQQEAAAADNRFDDEGNYGQQSTGNSASSFDFSNFLKAKS
ncbi:MAG: cell cycle transcriptional regulator TrcR [Pseudomonadota bacterium]